MLTEMQNQLWNALVELDGETVARLFTNYYGNQLLSDEFKDFLIDEGYMYFEDEEEFDY